MPQAINLTGVSVSGTLVPVASAQLHGSEAVRVYVKNTGAQAITAGKIQQGPDLSMLADIDTASLASIAASAVASARILGPVSGLKVLLTCAAGTTVDVVVDDQIGSSVG